MQNEFITPATAVTSVTEEVNQFPITNVTTDNMSATPGTDRTDANSTNLPVAMFIQEDSIGKPDAAVNVLDHHAETSEFTSPTLSTIPSISTDPLHIVNLKTAFNTAINNADFVKDVKKVEKLIAALTLVDPETRVRAQLETNAYKKLRADAARDAEQPGGIYIAPTKAAIDKYIEDGLKVWRDKQK